MNNEDIKYVVQALNDIDTYIGTLLSDSQTNPLVEQDLKNAVEFAAIKTKQTVFSRMRLSKELGL